LSTDVAAFAFEQLQPAAPNLRADAERGLSLAEIEALHEEARAAGEAEGRAQGVLAAHAEIDQALAGLSRAGAGIEQLRDELTATFEREAVELAFGIAEQILSGALEAQPERVVDVVRGALRRIVDRHRVTVLVNPTDLELVIERMDAMRTELGGIEHCDVQADRRVSRGGAVVETAAAEIDARIDTQLARAREVVAEALQRDA
jgi:flagellar assembly protein FliH